MKVALDQDTTPASATTQDYTDANVSDLKLALFFSTRASANNTVTDNSSFSMGATDGTTQRVCGISGPNGAASAGAMAVFNHTNTSNCAAIPDSNSGTPEALGAYSSTLATGIRVNYTTTAIQALMNAILISGTDVEAKVINQTLGTGASPVTTQVTHGMSAAPQVIIAIASLGSAKSSHGFYDVGNATYGCAAYNNINGVNPTQLGGYVGNDSIIAQMLQNTIQYKLTIANVGATTFDAVATGATIEADVITFICLRVTNGVFKVGVATAPTGTGVAALVSGMSVSPMIVLMGMSRITTVNTGDSGDASGAFGLGVVLNNNGSTQQSCCSLSSDDAAATSIEKSYTSNTKCVAIMDAAGAIDIEASHSSWDAGGVSLDWTNISGAVLLPYLAIGQSGTGILRQMMMQH